MIGFGYRKLLQISPRFFWVTYTAFLLQILVISGRVWDWPAGPTFGPRYLAPVLPLVALPCAFGVQQFPRLGIALTAYSIVITTLATLTDACPLIDANPNPIFDLNIPLLLKGELSPNLGAVLGLGPHASAGLFYVTLILCLWGAWRQLSKGESGRITIVAENKADA